MKRFIPFFLSLAVLICSSCEDNIKPLDETASHSNVKIADSLTDSIFSDITNDAVYQDITANANDVIETDTINISEGNLVSDASEDLITVDVGNDTIVDNGYIYDADSKDISVSEDIEYKYATVKSDNGRPELFINNTKTPPLIFFGSNTFIGSAIVCSLSQQMQVCEGTFKAVNDYNDANVHIELGLGSPATVWIDNIELIDLETNENLVWGGDFATGDWKDYWVLFTGAGGEANGIAENNELKVEVINTGTQGFSVHLYQKQNVKLTKGHKYRVAASMRADKARDARLFVVQQGGNWRLYSNNSNSKVLNEFSLAASSDIHIHSTQIPSFWPEGENSEPEFGYADQTIETILSKDRDGRLILRFYLNPALWWKNRYPEEMMKYEDTSAGSLPSIASVIWREDSEKILRKFIRHIEEKYKDRIIGYHLAGQNTDEWFYNDSWEHMSGFEKPFSVAFRQYVREKYHNSLTELREAYNNPIIVFEDIDVPSLDARRSGGNDIFYDPEKERVKIDYLEFHNFIMADTVERFAHIIKEETAGQKLVVYFFGYVFELGLQPYGSQFGGHQALSRILNSPDIDIIASPISYFDRELGGSAPFMSAIDSISIHNKIFVNEDDTRTYISDDFGFGHIYTLEGTIWAHIRNFANILVRGMGTWWMDLGGTGWLNDHNIWENISNLRGIYIEEMADPILYKPEIAVITDPESLYYLSAVRDLTSPLLYYFRREINRIGAPVGYYLFDDLIDGKVPDAKLYIMLNTFSLNQQERVAVNKIIKRDGKVSIWFYAPGYIDENSERTDNISSLLQIPIKEVTGISSFAKWYPGDALVQGLYGEFDTRVTFSPKFAAEIILGSETEIRPLAQFKDTYDCFPIVVKRDSNHKIIYSSGLYLPSAFLRNVAKEAGVFIYLDTDDIVQSNGRWLSVTLANGEEGKVYTRIIRLPGRYNVYDPINKINVAVNVDYFSLNLKFGEARLFKLVRADETAR